MVKFETGNSVDRWFCRYVSLTHRILLESQLDRDPSQRRSDLREKYRRKPDPDRIGGARIVEENFMDKLENPAFIASLKRFEHRARMFKCGVNIPCEFGPDNSGDLCSESWTHCLEIAESCKSTYAKFWMVFAVIYIDHSELDAKRFDTPLKDHQL